MVRWFLFRFEILLYQKVPSLYYMSGSAFLLLAPLLYLYIRSLCYKDSFLRKKDSAHLILFVLILVLSAIRGHVYGLPAASEPTPFTAFITSNYWRIFWTANLVQIFFYIIAMVRTVYNYQSRIRDLYSSLEPVNLQWLLSLLAVISLHWIFVTSRSLLSLFNIAAEQFTSVMDLFSITIFLVFTTILVFRGLNQLTILSGIDRKQKSGNATIPETELQRYVQHLTSFMEKKKPYLTPSLTIDDLSQELSIPSWHLSRAINMTFKQNFFNFINHYRVEEAKRLMIEPNNKKMTILEILYEVGFNSKSTFNDVFKKQTGMTPSQFKKAYQN